MKVKAKHVAEIMAMGQREQIARLKALVIEFVAATGWTDQSNIALRDARNRAAELVPEIVGNHPDEWERIVAGAKALRQRQTAAHQN